MGKISGRIKTAVVLLAASAASPALAITNGVAAAAGAFPYVGRDQTENTAKGNFFGTASYIAAGSVLTAGHCGNFLTGTDGMFYIGPVDERFELGGVQYYGLAVQEPQFAANPNAAAIADHDVAIYLLMNGPAAPKGGFPAVANANNPPNPPADAPLAVGNQVTVVGFTGSMAGGQPLTGQMQVTAVNPNSYAYGPLPAPAVQNVTQKGDSGGPQVNAGKIYSTTSNGDQATFTNSTRVDVDPNRAFIFGNGDGGVATVDRLAAAASVNWSAATWARGSANAAAAPGANDVVVLDPTSALDSSTTTITLDVNSPNLNGFANDVTLAVGGTTLNVGGSTGILNTGIINVMGAAASAVTTGMKIDDVGTINIGANGSVTAGGSLTAVPGTPFQESILIGASAAMNGFNQTAPGTPATAVNITAGGTLTDVNAANANAMIVMQSNATMTVTGSATATSTVTADAFDISGTININNAATLTANLGTVIETGGSLILTGSAALAGTSRLINGGFITINSGGMLSASRSPLTAAGHSMDNSGFITIYAGGSMNVADANLGADGTAAANTGSIVLAGAGGGGPAVLQVNDGGMTNSGTLSCEANSNLIVINTMSNNASSLIQLLGGTSMAMANFGSLVNSGGISVGDASQLTSAHTANAAAITVGGGTDGPGTASLGTVNNALGSLTINNGGVVNASVPAPQPADHSLDNAAAIIINGGGSLNVAGRPGADGLAMTNSGTINLVGSGGAANLNISAGNFSNSGTISLAGTSQILLQNSNLTTTAVINGSGVLRFTGNSSYLDQAVTAANGALDTRNVAFIFDAAVGPAAAPVTMETPTQDAGGGVPGLNTLVNDRSSIYDFSIINDSNVQLVDAFLNSAKQPEAIYTTYFGIQPGSTLNLNGLDIYYRYLDPNEGGLGGTINLNGGKLVQVPEPGSIAIMACAGCLLLRRRRTHARTK